MVTMSVNVILRLTRSQQIALVDILIAYMRSDDVQEFVDISSEITTTPGELLRLVGEQRVLEISEG